VSTERSSGIGRPGFRSESGGTDAGRVVGYYSLQLPPPQLRNTNVETLSLALRVERNGAEKVALFSAKYVLMDTSSLRGRLWRKRSEDFRKNKDSSLYL
jgi:hypothetical protein